MHIRMAGGTIRWCRIEDQRSVARLAIDLIMCPLQWKCRRVVRENDRRGLRIHCGYVAP